MNSLIIPSSPNWFASTILACSSDNTVIYGARCDIIYIQNVKNIPDVKTILKAHSKRLISIDINLKWGNPKKYFVSVGEDKIVKLWNGNNMTVESSHRIHEKSSMPVSVKFSGDDRVISVSEDRHVVVWNIKNDTTILLKDFLNVRRHITCMSMCPHAPWLAAFGTEDGLIIVADIRKNGTIIHKLPGHQHSVISLVWCPAPFNIFRKGPKVAYKEVDKGPTSTGAEGPSTESDNKLICEPSVSGVSTSTEVHETPMSPGSSVECHGVDNLGDPNSQPEKQEGGVQDNDDCNQPEGESSKPKNEGASEMTKPKSMQEKPKREYLLASSGKDGKICIWRAGTDGALQTFITSKNSGNRHKRNLDKSWTPLYWPTPTSLLSISRLFELVQYTLPKPLSLSKQLSVIHDCHRSTVFCIAGPTVLFTEENWLDDVHLNAWTFSQDHVLVNAGLNRERKVLTHFCTFDGAINCLSASPVNPSRLGIGTNQVKIWNMSSSQPGIINMSKHCQKMQAKIVRLAWHPNLESVFAFATSEGRIGYIDVNKAQKPKILQNHYKHQINKIEWGPVKDGIGLFVLSGGELMAFDINNHDDCKIVVDIPYTYTFSWKPNYTILFVACKTGSIVTVSKNLKKSSVMYFESKTESIVWHPQAAAVGDSTSKYHNYCATVRNNNHVLVNNFRSETLEIVSEHTAKGALVTAVSWSPFNDHLMVICTNSGVAEVWNAVKKCVISTCVDSIFNPIVCAIWSPISEDCIIMGCKEHCLIVWKVSEHKFKDKEEVGKLREIAYKELHSRSEESMVDEENKLSTEDSKEKRPDKLLPKSFQIRDSDHLITNIKKVITWQRSAGGDAPKPDILSLFGNSDCIVNMLKLNEETHLQRKKFDHAVTLSLFRGDVSSSIQAAIEEHRVTPTIITLAPLVSTRMWQDACEAYAKQLAELPDSDPVEIAVHYLLCHKIHQAIDVLCESRMYHEAFALAKCRLPEENDTITNIVNKWIIYLIQNGNYELAAVCYIYLEEYEDAAMLLFKRSGKLLGVAAELANIAGNKTLEETILAQHAKLESNTEKETHLMDRIETMLRLQQKTDQGSASIEQKTKLSIKDEDEKMDETTEVAAELANITGNKIPEETILTHSTTLESDTKKETPLLDKAELEDKTPKGDDSIAHEAKLSIKGEDGQKDETSEIPSELANITGNKVPEETILTTTLESDTKEETPLLDKAELEDKTVKGDDSMAHEAKPLIKKEDEDKTSKGDFGPKIDE